MPNVAEKFSILVMSTEAPYSHENQPRTGKDDQLNTITSVVMRVRVEQIDFVSVDMH